MNQDRRDEIEAGLVAVRERIDAPARLPAAATDITLVVVTKFFPASDVRLLADLGVRHVGENRHQEAVEKAAECADLDVAGTSSVRCRATRRQRSPATPTSCTPSTAPSCSAG